MILQRFYQYGLPLVRKTSFRAHAVQPQYSCVGMTTSTKMSQFLEIPESVDNGPARKIAYHKLEGTSGPGVVYIPGFGGHSGGVKPQVLMELCKQKEIPFVTYDPTGLGASKGEYNWTQARLSYWIMDAQQAITQLTQGPQLVVGSSMGCWISCLLSQRCPLHIGAMLLISPAINFGPQYKSMLEHQLPPSLLAKLQKGEVVNLQTKDYGEIPLQMSLFEDMVRNETPQEPGSLKVDSPVRIIYSMKDIDVPYSTPNRLFGSFSGDDVQLQLLKGGSHQLHEPDSLDLIKNAMLKLRQHVVFGGPGENSAALT